MLKTVIVSKNSFFLHTLASVLDAASFKIVMQVDDLDVFEKARSARARDIDVIVIEDAEAASDRILAKLAALHRRRPVMKSLLVVPNFDAAFLSKMFESGCSGCLPSNVPLNAIAPYLRLAADGQRILPDGAADLLQQLVLETTPPADATALRSRLTERETCVLSHLLRGAPNKLIASKLHVPLTTVKADLKSIMRKTGAQNRTALAVSAVKIGFFGSTGQVLSIG